MSWNISNMRWLANGTRLFTMKKLPTAMPPTMTSSGRSIFGSDMPADFIASSS